MWIQWNTFPAGQKHHWAWDTHIQVSADQPQDHIYADEGARPPDARAAVGDDGPRLVHVPHVGDEGEQIVWLGGSVVVRPGNEVQVGNVPHFTCLRFKNNTAIWHVARIERKKLSSQRKASEQRDLPSEGGL